MKQIILNAFFQNCPGHQSMGMWRHPRDQSLQYKSMSYWTDLAKTLEKGLFDGIFLADVVGIYDVYGGNADAALSSGVQVPGNDPLLIIPAMAMVTKNLGFGVTCNITHDEPYMLARRFSTLDHLTDGRIGWNVVTGYLDSGARSRGAKKMASRDERYDMADDYMKVVYKLWEQSWEDDAMTADKGTGTFINPYKVHTVKHTGEYFDLDAIHMCEPSPQRTPVIYQAGASARGQVFASRHAECIFVNGPSKNVLRSMVDNIRKNVAEHDRDPTDVKIIALVTVVVGKTEEEAQEKYKEYTRYVDRTGALVLMSGWTGIDFSQFGMDDEIKHIKNNAIQTAVDRFTVSDPDKVWTVGELADHLGLGGASPVIVGSVENVVSEMEAFIKETGIDGFNIAYTVEPESMKDFVDLVVPELQARGLHKTEYREGTLREKLFNNGAKSKLVEYRLNE